MSRTREQLESYLKTLHIECDTLLDVGGSQLPILSRLGSLKANKVLIADLPVPHVEKQKPDYSLNLNDYISVTDPIWDVDPDVIFCLEVMEYVWNPVQAMDTLYMILKKGGTMYISFPFVYPAHNLLSNDYLRYTEFGSRKLLEHSGFMVEDVVYRTADMDSIMDFYISEGMKYHKDYHRHNAVGFIYEVKK